MRYTDVLNGFEGMTIMETLGSGCNGRTAVQLMGFRNPSRSYPIRWRADAHTAVAYRLSPKRFIECALFCGW